MVLWSVCFTCVHVCRGHTGHSGQSHQMSSPYPHIISARGLRVLVRNVSAMVAIIINNFVFLCVQLNFRTHGKVKRYFLPSRFINFLSPPPSLPLLLVLHCFFLNPQPLLATSSSFSLSKECWFTLLFWKPGPYAWFQWGTLLLCNIHKLF